MVNKTNIGHLHRKSNIHCPSLISRTTLNYVKSCPTRPYTKHLVYESRYFIHIFLLSLIFINFEAISTIPYEYT